MPDVISLSLVDPEASRVASSERFRNDSSDSGGIAWGVNAAANQSSADLLHVPQFSAPIRASLPLVATIHDLIPFRVPEYRRSKAMRAYLEVMRRTVRQAAVAIVPSEFVAASVIEMLKFEADRIRIIPMAASRSLMPATDRETIPNELRDLGIDGPYVFNIAGFDIRKNLPGLLEAFARFRMQSGRPYKLVIAGAPHTSNPVVFPPLSPIIERLGLARHVILPGLVSESTKLALYQHAAMYVTPSLEEGFGMTCLEAMSCATPTIASNRASLPEVVSDGGLLVPPEPEALAEAMLLIDGSAGLAHELGQRGVNRAAHFSWSLTAELTIDAYRDVLCR